MCAVGRMPCSKVWIAIECHQEQACSMVRMQLLRKKAVKTKINRNREIKATDGSGPTSSLPKTDLLEQQMLTQQTPVLAVDKSGQARLGQDKPCHDRKMRSHPSSPRRH